MSKYHGRRGTPSYLSVGTWAKHETMGYPKSSVGAQFHPQSMELEFPGASPKREDGCTCAESRRLVALCRADVWILNVLLLLITRASAIHILFLWDIHSSFYLKHLFLNCLIMSGPLSLAVRRVVPISRCISPGPRRPWMTSSRRPSAISTATADAQTLSYFSFGCIVLEKRNSCPSTILGSEEWEVLGTPPFEWCLVIYPLHIIVFLKIPASFSGIDSLEQEVLSQLSMNTPGPVYENSYRTMIQCLKTNNEHSTFSPSQYLWYPKLSLRGKGNGHHSRLSRSLSSACWKGLYWTLSIHPQYCAHFIEPQAMRSHGVQDWVLYPPASGWAPSSSGSTRGRLNEGREEREECVFQCHTPRGCHQLTASFSWRWQLVTMSPPQYPLSQIHHDWPLDYHQFHNSRETSDFCFIKPQELSSLGTAQYLLRPMGWDSVCLSIPLMTQLLLPFCTPQELSTWGAK